jgi:DNA mismatch repair protein MutL
MSVTDARLCFERHATSKFVKLNLFSLHTKGFRGEALSIAAIAHVEMKTKQEQEELEPILLKVVNLYLKTLLFCQKEPRCCQNLFFNIPARVIFKVGYGGIPPYYR